MAGGVSGVLITQRRSDLREEKTWTRERDREHERWAREDEARTFEHRREAYAEFYEAVKLMARAAYDKGYGFIELEQGELPDDWHEASFGKLQRLTIYATPEVAEAAAETYNAAWRWGQYGAFDCPEDPEFTRRQGEYDAVEIRLVRYIRGDLAIPGGQLTTIRSASATDSAVR